MFYIAVSTAPLISIFISEFPGDDVVPIGYNLTIFCIGNKSREGSSLPFSKQPFRVQLFFKKRAIKLCGGITSDRSDTKTCAYRIEKASRNKAGEYGCLVTNFMRCSVASLTLHLVGKYDNLLDWTNVSEFLKIIMNVSTKLESEFSWIVITHIWKTALLNLPEANCKQTNKQTKQLFSFLWLDKYYYCC